MNRWIRSLLPLPALVAGACKPSETPGREDTAGTAPMQTIPSLPVQVSFNDHVQPVLSEYCYHCHGPDAGTREPTTPFSRPPVRPNGCFRGLRPKANS